MFGAYSLWAGIEGSLLYTPDTTRDLGLHDLIQMTPRLVASYDKSGTLKAYFIPNPTGIQSWKEHATQSLWPFSVFVGSGGVLLLAQVSVFHRRWGLSLSLSLSRFN